MKPVALIIDDDPASLDILAALLTREGVTPVTLPSPRNLPITLDLIGQVDLIFLDLEFPNYNGLRLVERLQADERLSGVPFVAYTLHTSEQGPAREAGFHSFLGKPLNIQQFPEQLSRILHGEPVWAVT